MIMQALSLIYEPKLFVAVSLSFINKLLHPSPDRVLESFAQQQGLWRYCVYFVRHSRNEHVLMFSLNLLEVGPSDYISNEHVMMRSPYTHSPLTFWR